jgi:hypothetical protein
MVSHWKCWLGSANRLPIRRLTLCARPPLSQTWRHPCPEVQRIGLKALIQTSQLLKRLALHPAETGCRETGSLMSCRGTSCEFDGNNIRCQKFAIFTQVERIWFSWVCRDVFRLTRVIVYACVTSIWISRFRRRLKAILNARSHAGPRNRFMQALIYLMYILSLLAAIHDINSIASYSWQVISNHKLTWSP